MSITFMDIIDLRCNKSIAFNFEEENRCHIGHLVNMSFVTNCKKLVQDIKTCNPVDPNLEENIAGIFEFIGWEGFDIINLGGNLSAQNTATFVEFFSTATESPVIELEWVIYAYDYHSKKYFKRFHTNNQMIAFEVTNGTRVYANDEPDRVIKNPVSFQFNLSLAAHEKKPDQELYFATSATGKTHKRKLQPNVS